MNYEDILRRGLAIVLCLCMVAPYWSLTDFAKDGEHHTEATEQTEVANPTETTPPINPEPVPTEPTEPEPTSPQTSIDATGPGGIGINYFDIPLSEDLQDHIFKLCAEYNIDPVVVIAVIDKESDFRPKLMGDKGASYGLMQIQKKHHQDRMDKLGVTDLLDPYQNVAVGIDFLAELFRRDKPLEWVLMAYNGGASYANRKWEAGEISSYVTKVINTMVELKVSQWGITEPMEDI